MNPSFWTVHPSSSSVLDTASWVLSVEALAIYPMEGHQQLLLEFLLEILSGILKVVLLDRKLVPESAISSPMVAHSAIYTTVEVSAIYSMEEVLANDAMEAASAIYTMVASMVGSLEG